MSQKKTLPAPVKARAGKPDQAPSYGRTIRETVDAVVIAFVLAFLFRTFEAEAFVIPTGSMAPTLQGAHKEIVCPHCSYTYRVGASSEAEDEMGAPPNQTLQQQERGRRDKEVVKGTCPMCRYTKSLDSQDTTYSGDRILVGKFPYDFAEPDRWDVVVFKYPGDAKMNYIKRLVGLPEETVRIYHGDILTSTWAEASDQRNGDQSKGAQSDFEIQRKSPAKLKAMSQPVYDNDYIDDSLTEKGWPVRWQPVASQSAGPQWQTTDGSRSYQIDANAKGAAGAWIRYRHFVPTEDDWRQLSEGRFSGDARAQLVTDFYAYNTGVQRGATYSAAQGLHWVGDLILEAELDVRGSDGLVLLDLVKGGKHFGCAIDVATGKATLSIDGVADFQPSAQTAVRGPGSHRVRFSNVDRELRLWVDDAVVAFDSPTTYAPLNNEVPKSDEQDPGDLAPVGIGSQGASLRVEHMRILRDIYYIADKEENMGTFGGIWDYERDSPIPMMRPRELADFFSDPRRWRSAGPGQRGPFQQRRVVDFPLKKDQFFVLGDNSPCSKDSRLWYPHQYVERKLLIGKALFIYWPASHHRIPGVDVPFPYFPNLSGMGLVR